MHCAVKMQFCAVRTGDTYGNHLAVTLLNHHGYFTYYLL
jgi:hypothetical protein